MKQVALLYAMIVSVALTCAQVFGPHTVVVIVFGAIALMALLIAGTFAWLWHARATPLALGMSLSWAGTGFTLGWWWILNIVQDAGRISGAVVLLFSLSLLMAGAVIHFSVIQGTFGLRGWAFIVPVVGAFAMSLGVLLLV
ncbi:hypothetical protein [Celeribacter arenosi]|uniref:Uncharacterized protein n=1 Tax=Celeribacter arenosi TaxID=792649 RepID=A0ABP7KBH4_9RHOB